MTRDLVLLSNPMSRGRVVRWMLEEVGASYRVDYLGFGSAMRTPAFLALNPMGKVPVLLHGDTVVTETAAILAYLADAFPEAGLAPPPAERGAYYRWLFFVAGPVEQATSIHLLGVTPTQEQQWVMGCGALGTLLDTLETAVAGDGFVAGPAFSAADVLMSSFLGWGMHTGSIEKRPAFEAYCERTGARPAHQRAEEMDNAAAEALKQGHVA